MRKKIKETKTHTKQNCKKSALHNARQHSQCPANLATVPQVKPLISQLVGRAELLTGLTGAGLADTDYGKERKVEKRKSLHPIIIIIAVKGAI